MAALFLEKLGRMKQNDVSFVPKEVAGVALYIFNLKLLVAFIIAGKTKMCFRIFKDGFGENG